MDDFLRHLLVVPALLAAVLGVVATLAALGRLTYRTLSDPQARAGLRAQRPAHVAAVAACLYVAWLAAVLGADPPGSVAIGHAGVWPLVRFALDVYVGVVLRLGPPLAGVPLFVAWLGRYGADARSAEVPRRDTGAGCS